VESLRDSAGAVNQAPDMSEGMIHAFGWTHDVGPPQTIMPYRLSRFAFATAAVWMGFSASAWAFSSSVFSVSI